MTTDIDPMHGGRSVGNLDLQQDIEVSREDLRAYYVHSWSNAAARILFYLLAIAVLCGAIWSAQNLWIIGGSIIGLGFIYAHGLELQHQTFHNSLFRSKRLNRAFGLLLGLPMLELFTETRLQHLHHHRHAGTQADVFDRKLRHFPTLGRLLANAWNIQRIPSFAAASAGLLRGRYPPLCGSRSHRHVQADYAAALGVIALACLAGIRFGFEPVVLIWLVPWLLIAEPVHFIIGMTEHLGRDENSTRVLQNARSYRANLVWEYIANYDNYHAEHHAWPGIPAHRLPALNRHLAVKAPMLALTFAAAVQEVHHGLRRARAEHRRQLISARKSSGMGPVR